MSDAGGGLGDIREAEDGLGELLNAANERAALAVRILLTDAGYEEVLVRTQVPAAGECP